MAGIMLWQVSTPLHAEWTLYSDRKDVRAYADQLVRKHKFNRAELLGLFRGVRKQQAVLDAIAKPAERELTWKEYRPIFIKYPRIQAGVEFRQQYSDALERAEVQFGVPAEIIVAIMGVETFFGKHTGKHPVLDSLVTLSFDGDRRQEFFRRELEEFLLLAKEQQVDPFSIKGSYAGAMGWPQFISSSYRAYAIDFDSDGKRDLWNNPVDAIGSVANYFRRHGWEKGGTVVVAAQLADNAADLSGIAVERGRAGLKPAHSVGALAGKGVRSEVALPPEQLATLLKLQGEQGDEYWLGLKNFYVITRYNHSAMYAMAVYQLAGMISGEHAAELARRE
jgi:membrane-bound lytic murein transglycosylase B